MRIRKRTPVRAALPGPSPPSPPCLLLHPKAKPIAQCEEEGEEEQVSLVVGGREEDQVLVASKDSLRSAKDEPKPKPQAAGGGMCRRNDGKQWRCKSAAMPGYAFCERHIAWSTRKRKSRTKKKSQSSILEPSTEDEPAATGNDEEEAKNQWDGNGDGDGDDGLYYYYGGFQPGRRKRAKRSGAGSD